MRVKRTTYATRAGDDEIAKVSLEIKQIIKQLQKDKVLGEYAKIIQSLKREYQTVYTEKKQIERFFKKT